MLITENDLTMTAIWTPVEKIDETGDIVEHPEQVVKTWMMDNKFVFVQRADGYSKVPAKAYILAKTSSVKQGDKLDGIFVQKVHIVNDFDGSIDHIEAYTY